MIRVEITLDELKPLIVQEIKRKLKAKLGVERIGIEIKPTELEIVYDHEVPCGFAYTIND